MEEIELIVQTIIVTTLLTSAFFIGYKIGLKIGLKKRIVLTKATCKYFYTTGFINSILNPEPDASTSFDNIYDDCIKTYEGIINK